MTDPYTRAYQAIMAAFRAWVPLTTLVKPGNFRDLSTPQGAVAKRTVQAADLPELRLGESRAPFNLEANSLGIRFEMYYPVMVAAGSMQVETVNAVVWETARALIAYDKQHLMLGLTDIVQKWNLTGDASVAAARLQKDRGQLGFTAILTVHVFFAMRTADLIQS